MEGTNLQLILRFWDEFKAKLFQSIVVCSWSVGTFARNFRASVCRRSGPDRSYGPKTRTGPKFGTGPKTGPPKLPKYQYIFSVLKMKIAHFAVFVVSNMGRKFFNCR